MVNGESSGQLIKLVNNSMDEGSLLVFLFHGVGGGHDLNVSLQDHRDLLLYLKNNQSQIWVATMRDVLIFLKNI
nr:chitooligosaccharide deacetylase [Bacteroidota bacterium]